MQLTQVPGIVISNLLPSLTLAVAISGRIMVELFNKAFFTEHDAYPILPETLLHTIVIRAKVGDGNLW